MHSLPIFLILKNRPVILIGSGDTAVAKRRLLERAGARVEAEEADAQLAIVALDNEEEARAAAARLKARGILVNVPDRPALCDFTMPAIVDRDPVIIAIGTGGASAGLAKALRQRFEALLPPGLGALANALDSARAAIRMRWPDAANRRRAIDAALAPGAILDPAMPFEGDAARRWLERDDEATVPRLVTIRLRSPDPDDLTVGQARWLAQADCIRYRADIPPAILDRARADAVRLPGDSATDEISGLTVAIDWER